MQNQYILISLQERFKTGGFVLLAPRSGRVYAYGKDIKKLYEKIKRKEISSENKIIMYVPRPDVSHVFCIPL